LHLCRLYKIGRGTYSILYAPSNIYVGTGAAARRMRPLARSNPMLDAILLAAGVGFFALSIAYAFGCDLL
jgi:hypothetical protein